MVLEAQNLSKSFHGRRVLPEVSFSVARGEFLCLLGPSGCGKSTLLRLLAGLESADAGTIKKASDLAPAFVFQDSQLLSWRSALENVRLPLELQARAGAEEQNSRAREALRQVGLSEASTRFPHELSGGMKMRVSLARALSGRPKLLFMDEPLSALDEIHRHRLQIQLRALCQAEQLTTLFVTHSSSEAAFLADRVLVMDPHGNISTEIPVSYSKPRDENLRQSPEFQSTQARISRALQEGAR